MIRAIVKKRWEVDATAWTRAEKDAIQFARLVKDENPDGTQTIRQLFCVYGRGYVLTGDEAEKAIAADAAVAVVEDGN